MKSVTKELLAKKLNNRQWDAVITKAEEKVAKENNLVVVFGYSDDMTEFRGAINAEVDSEDSVFLSKKGLLRSDCSGGDDGYCPYFQKLCKKALKNKTALELNIHWGGAGIVPEYYKSIKSPSWCYTFNDKNTSAATFDIFDDRNMGEYYCRGLVLDLDELFPSTEVKENENV